MLDYLHGQGWMHSIAAPDEADHIAVPVSADEVQVRGRCDFCFTDEPTWVLPVTKIRYEIPGHGGGGFDSDWAACDDCAALIDRNQWNALLRRVKMSWQDRHGPMPDTTETQLKGLYRTIRKNVSGSLKKL